MAIARVGVELVTGRAVAAAKKLQQSVNKVEEAVKKNVRQSNALQKAFFDLRLNGSQATKVIKRGLDSARQSAVKLKQSLKGTAGVLAGLGAGAALTGSVRGAADLAQTQIRLQALSEEYGEFGRIQRLVAQNAKTFNLSQKESASQFADVYARLRPLGISLDAIQSTFKGFNATAIASGASAQAASGAFLQLSQALGSGRLQGDEFRSIAEQVPGVLRLVAKEMNVTVGELKQLGSDGKITSDILINALANGFEENRDKIEKIIELSPAQKFKELSNATSNLSDAVGTELLPAVTPLVEGLTELIKITGRLPGPIKTLGSALFGLAAAATAAAAAMNALGLSVSAAAIKGFAVLGAKIALVLAPLAAVALAFQDAQDRKEAFDAALKSDSLDVVESALKQATAETMQLEQRLQIIKKSSYFKGQAGDVQRLQQEIDVAREKVIALTERRQLFIDVVFGIPDFDKMGPGFEQELAQELKALGLKYKGPSKQVSALKPKGRAGAGRTPAERPDITQKTFELENRLLQAKEQGFEREMATLELMIERQRVIESEMKPLEAKLALNKAEVDFRLRIKAIDKEIADQRLQDQKDAQQAFNDFFKAEQDAAQRRLEADPFFQMKQQLEELVTLENQVALGATAIGSAFANSFRSLIDGSKSGKEALADMMSSIGEHFMDMAAQIIAQQLTMILYGTIMKALGIPMLGAVGGGGPSAPKPFFEARTPGLAEGGFVDRPINALIGEGGEPEYVIPESKMRESMARYSRGSRGASVIPESGGSGSEEGGGTAVAAPIDVRYTVERINNVDYVTSDQFQRGLQSAATQGAKQGEQNTLKRLQMSGSTRKRLGL